MATLGDPGPLPAAAGTGGALPVDTGDVNQLFDLLLWYHGTNVVALPGYEFSVRPPRDGWRDLLVAAGH